MFAYQPLTRAPFNNNCTVQRRCKIGVSEIYIYMSISQKYGKVTPSLHANGITHLVKLDPVDLNIQERILTLLWMDLE